MGFSRLSQLVPLFLIMTMVTAQKYQNSSKVTDNTWFNLGRMTGSFLKSCWPGTSLENQGTFVFFQSCIQQKSLLLLTKTLQSDVIEILDGVQLVKFKEDTNFSRKQTNKEDSDWETQIMTKIIELFETHTLTIRLEDLVEQDTNMNEARRRHHHKHGNGMMHLLMFGLVAMGMLLIPMGFKFLTVLGAKALLLAKMALILTSIQGLKKVATSGINYGLYHAPQTNAWHYDRHGEDVPDEQLDFMNHKYVRS